MRTQFQKLTSLALAPAVLCAGLAASEPAEAQSRSRYSYGPGSSFKRGSTPSMSQAYIAVGFMFLMASSDSGKSEAEQRALFEKQAMEVINNPSPDNIAKLKPSYAPHAKLCVEQIPAPLKSAQDQSALINHFKTCLQREAYLQSERDYNARRIEWASNTPEAAKTSDYNLYQFRSSSNTSYASFLPTCQAKHQVVPGQAKPDLATAEKVLACIKLEEKKESDHNLGISLLMFAGLVIGGASISLWPSRRSPT